MAHHEKFLKGKIYSNHFLSVLGFVYFVTQRVKHGVIYKETGNIRKNVPAIVWGSHQMPFFFVRLRDLQGTI